MGFERLGDVIDRVLASSGIDVGNGAAATAPNAEKGAGEKSPASWREDNILHADRGRAYREIAVATPAPRRASPTQAAAISLYVIEGSGSRGHREDAPAAVRATGGGDPRGTVLRFHAGT